MEDQAEYKQDQKSSQPDVPAANLETASARFIAAIFHVIAGAARCPSHNQPPSDCCAWLVSPQFISFNDQNGYRKIFQHGREFQIAIVLERNALAGEYVA